MSAWGRKATREQIITAILLLLALVSRLGTFRMVQLADGGWIWLHIDTDERIYRALVEQHGFFHYTLQGTALLPKLPAAIYDFPLFFHPPFFVYTSWLLEKLIAFPLVPVLTSLATILAARSIARRLFANEGAVICTVLLLVCCPLGWFLSQKYWIDSLQALMATLSFALLLKALQTGRRFWLAGLVVALSLLTKYLAVVAFPALAILYFLQRGRGWKLKELLALSLPALLLGGAWLALSLAMNGVIFPQNISYDPVRFPYMAQIQARPWFFYFYSLVVFTPAYLLAFFSREKFLWAWVGCYFLFFTFFGLSPFGYTTRALAPAYPALALLAAPVLARIFQSWRTVWLGGILLTVHMIHGVAYGFLYSATKSDFHLHFVNFLRQWIGS